LTFELRGETYGVPILDVEEIRGREGFTVVPNTGPALLGVLNLRGVIIPIVDLARHLGLSTRTGGPGSVIVVVRCGNSGRLVGLLVEIVSDVLSVSPEQARSAPALCEDLASGIVGLASVEGGTVNLLDVSELLAWGDLAPQGGAPPG
ncbi:MAG: purine-binding chemotaxis protein CheW, partial [Planctomycetes bacterium]|nr:purine-binding chemotaxis protein CheW [Planctomycetota bacterium]